MIRNGIIGKRGICWGGIKYPVFFRRIRIWYLLLASIWILLGCVRGWSNIHSIRKFRKIIRNILRIRILLRILWGLMIGLIRDCRIWWWRSLSLKMCWDRWKGTIFSNLGIFSCILWSVLRMIWMPKILKYLMLKIKNQGLSP